MYELLFLTEFHDDFAKSHCYDDDLDILLSLCHYLQVVSRRDTRQPI